MNKIEIGANLSLTIIVVALCAAWVLGDWVNRRKK